MSTPVENFMSTSVEDFIDKIHKIDYVEKITTTQWSHRLRKQSQHNQPHPRSQLRKNKQQNPSGEAVNKIYRADPTKKKNSTKSKKINKK